METDQAGVLREKEMGSEKNYPNTLGLWGWIGGGRWGLERYLYILHRITGIGIFIYFILHIFVTFSRVYGKEVWESWMGFLHAPYFAAGEFLVFAAFSFHAFNGIRLILIELGFAVGKAEEPIYPYTSSISKQRPVMIVAMIITAILVAAGGADFLGLMN